MKFGITQSFDCSYLPQQQEQLLVYAGEEKNLSDRYGQLIQAGFRRSGEQIYRPHCPQCQACQSLRIPVAEFRPSRSQKRVLSRNKHLRSVLGETPTQEYYPLYERYIAERHADGTMYPPSPRQFDSFIQCSWKAPLFVEAYEEDELIAVAVTDNINDHDDISDRTDHSAFSALYTFFAPEREKASIGTWMILQQIAHAAHLGKKYLYLGYQVTGCQKMSYKQKFLPHDRFFANKWHRISKKAS